MVQDCVTRTHDHRPSDTENSPKDYHIHERVPLSTSPGQWSGGSSYMPVTPNPIRPRTQSGGLHIHTDPVVCITLLGVREPSTHTCGSLHCGPLRPGRSLKDYHVYPCPIPPTSFRKGSKDIPHESTVVVARSTRVGVQDPTIGFPDQGSG